MATFATNLTTPANAIVSALATASSNAQTLATNIAQGLPGTTLVGLASKNLSQLFDQRVALANAMQDLARAQQEFVTIASNIAALGTLD
ncbi:hypothetical protein [Bradyrhizobium guangdongense]|uniref:Uncharacterized protein n=1 Tax=Bradyrhizobium guangdongense TaxID=1325090 RepID=A0A410V7I3_9BRAD|nr:hypothetical protein [Bradyrhizobium guangdongense]QAU39590.1 hypothetical protein X265_19425 [Bradyrhizobium guangdongense]QOZ60651.1 hypothetical protein XH86_19435 [Bradyrhizobium guangdongense]GGI24137.1 hypothetical protein GCM10010987_27880 [Bradyrhizobium guangdongense]